MDWTNCTIGQCLISISTAYKTSANRLSLLAASFLSEAGSCTKFLEANAFTNWKRKRDHSRNPTNQCGQVDWGRDPVFTSIIDERVPVVVTVHLNGVLVYGALLDGGSKVNTISTLLRVELSIHTFPPTPLEVKMAYQQWVQPIGLLKDL